MVHPLRHPTAGPRKLTQSVLQIAEMLGMYRAELARVLGLQCGDIGALANAQRELAPATPAWEQAQLFVRFYQALYQQLAGDDVAMCHWLRAENKDLEGMPLLLVVDEAQLTRVVAYLEEK